MTSALQGAQTGTKVTVMSDHDTPKIRQPEPINITVLRVRNLKGQRGDQVNVLVKVEFGEKSLGESPKENCSPEAEAELNYSAHLTCSFDDPHSLNEISTKPVILTVIEVIPNEKKKSKKDEEKSVVLGQSTIDLMPLLQGETTRKLTLPIHPVAGSAIENLAADAPKPEVDVVVSVNEPLLSEEQLKDANLLSITVESVYSPPESWANQPAAYVYTAALPMPQSAEKEVPLVYAGGSLKPGIEKEVPNKQKKWAMPGAAEGGAVYIPDQVIASDAIDDEDGDYRNKDDRDHRQISETDKNRVTWNIERRGYLDSSATKSLQDKIAKCRYWPLEVVRTNVPAAAKGKKEDDGHVGFHGVVYLDLAPLLYPGVRRIHGAYKIRPFNEHELLEKTNRKGSVADEAVKIAAGILSRSTASPFPKPAGKKEDAKGGKEPKKGGKGGKGADPPPSAMAHQKQEQHSASVASVAREVSTTKASDSASEAEGPVVNAEGMQYVEAKSYIKIDLVLHRPLVRKRPPEELATRVAEYIPPRPMFPKRTDGAQRAVEDFHNQIGVVGNLILDEFREQFGDALTALTSGHEANTQDDMETRRQKIIYHLNTSGKFFAFKEQLKHSVVKIVREKYLKTTTFKDKDELQAFLSDLYVYLLDQMHVGLNKVLSVEDQSPIPQPLTDSAQLKHFAREAEVNENFELATKYYQERIARDKSDPDTWMDYGTFCLYINDLTKAEECFKECVSIDQRHLYGLLLYGVVCTMQDKHESAETFFESATSFQPQSILAWTMLGLFYDGTGNEIGTEMALIEANKLNVAKAAEELRAAKEEEIRLKAEAAAAAESAPKEDLESAHPDPGSTTQEDPEPPGTAHTPSAASPREQSKAPLTPTSQASETKGAPKPAANKARPTSRTKSGKLLGNNKDAANSSRPESIHKSPAPAPATAGAPGEEGAHHEEHAAPEAIATPPVPTQTIFMHVVEWLLEVKAMPFTERALAHHLLDEAGGTSAEYYIAMARLQLQKHDMEEAEAALKAALAIDHQHPDGWAIMGHVKYLLGDTEVAKDCYERTLAFVADASEMHSIYLRLASIYLQENKYLEAKKTFLLACKRSPSCVSWLGVGIACYRLGELSEAEDALSEANILNNTDPEVWAYLSLVCLKTGRQLESEQAYKYAIKLNLPDEALLNELHEVQEEVGFGNPQL